MRNVMFQLIDPHGLAAVVSVAQTAQDSHLNPVALARDLVDVVGVGRVAIFEIECRQGSRRRVAGRENFFAGAITHDQPMLNHCSFQLGRPKL